MMFSAFPRFRAHLLTLPFFLFPAPLWAENERTLTPLIITAPAMDASLEATFDPKKPQQPQPANDGASFLKTIPGVSVIRKGGANGDPVFRGMAASRLHILLDGEQILGGCGGRMDPPTAYVFPESYDAVTLLKGPQSVIYGAGASAGTVRFERKPSYFAAPAVQASTAATLGSFHRQDGFADVKAGNRFGYAQGIFTYARSGDYRDGNGGEVHSRYTRYSGAAILGWTPDKDTRLEFSAVRSDAKAAYADRGMDGSKFERENYALKFEKTAIGSFLDKVEAQAYYNYIDHVMDNYSLRDTAAKAMASNPDRKTFGGRFAVTLLPAERFSLVIGADTQKNIHTARSGGRSGAANYYREQNRKEDFRFRGFGFFGEATWQASAHGSVIFGAREDTWRTKDNRATLSVGSGMMAAARPNPTYGQSRRETLFSGFARYEHAFPFGTAYAGLGHSERAPDFWEISKESPGNDNTNSLSAFQSIRPEKTTQLDLGTTLRRGEWKGFVSAFYGRIRDYILIQSQYAKPGAMMGTRAATIARNIAATTWGGEAGVSYHFLPSLQGAASLAYARGKNNGDHRALGQIPPLEARFSLDWDNGTWSAGALWRLVAAQNRYALHEGNIVGQDLGKSGGFGVFSLNGGYRFNKAASISFGVDNMFNKTYAEYLSKGGVEVTGYEQTTRVNEPGRAFWLRAQFALH
ncbi:MAG: TonB-dependent copper receptor [Zoogloeaceae bacterium]|jgi:iron complex outermembrane receptor protein|nr:TonB-dependent copper receptor [Zoogloeaceae bacterium]